MTTKNLIIYGLVAVAAFFAYKHFMKPCNCSSATKLVSTPSTSTTEPAEAPKVAAAASNLTGTVKQL
jgi:hypothetical protein